MKVASWSQIFLLLISVCNGQVCRTYSEWCTMNYDCEAIVGTEITIPCANVIDQPVSYINTTNHDVLAANTSGCLKLNLTVFDNNGLVTCQPSEDSGSFVYRIKVNYSPRVIVPIQPAPGLLKSSYRLTCPLEGNPPPVYSPWDILYCVNNTPAVPPGVSYTDNTNKTIQIDKLSLEFINICFICTATNHFGQGEHYFPRIRFDFCAASNTELYLSPGTPIIYVSIGEDIQLNCSVFPVTFITSCAEWTFNNTTIDSAVFTSDDNSCIETQTLFLKNVTFEESGNYTCTCDQPRSLVIERTIELRVIENDERPTVQVTLLSKDYQLLAIFIPVLLALVITASVIIVISVILLRRRRSNKTMSAVIEMKGAHDIEFDVFISFAEDDRNFAETELKENLEKKGYKIAWHHDVFIPGCSILENMEIFILKSRVVIAVLSGHYKNSDFCMKELYIALRKEKQTGVRCIVPVLLHNLSHAVPEVLSVKTYLSTEDKHFKDKLIAAIGEPHDPSP